MSLWLHGPSSGPADVQVIWRADLSEDVLQRENPDAATATYVVAYDITDPRRWRRVFKTMKSYGVWLQLSVFHCRLDGGRRSDMAMALESLIDRETDHVVILDLGPAEDVQLAVESLGKSFAPIERRAVVI